jgi:peptide alpha-N-acetyltransferase
MEFVNKAIEHTPTVVELYLHKAKLYQRMGNQKEAVTLTEEARNLDLADRYLNAHSSKYLFKDDRVQQANQTMALFSRDQEEQKLNVHEMATLWYEYHCGMAHFRGGELRQSLKQFSFLERHWKLMYDDCCDFFYCSMRRGTVLHYLQMYEW